MNYHLHRRGASQGPFPLEELRRWREAGELTGGEFVWREGMPTWQTLDAVLRRPPPDLPPAPAHAPRRNTNPALMWVVGLAIVMCVVGLGAVGWVVIKTRERIQQGISQGNPNDGVTAASKPISWTTNTLTAQDVQKRGRAFRVRQWLEGYDQRGDHSQLCDASARRLIETWIDQNYGGLAASNSPSPAEQADTLATDPGCTDPLVLTVMAANSTERDEKRQRIERAVAGFESSHHRAYPKFYATVILAGEVGEDRARLGKLDADALRLLKEVFADGSVQPWDQAELAEILLNGWGSGFAERNRAAVHPVVGQAGKTFAWLALVLEGEHHVKEAWKARGGGFVNTVSSEGWQGFHEHSASARSCLTEAWTLHPEWPLAASRMVYVAMGDSDAEGMRLWFDRAVTAQIDHAGAWSSLRWGLRPRWHGSRAAMLALGVAALNTERFDTDVPRKFFDAVSDLESEAELPPGEHLYGRNNIWPHLRRMYEGYIGAAAQTESHAGWRSSYAVVAHLAGHGDLAREQLEALHWQPRAWNHDGWGVELSLLPLEVAARTGAASNQIAEAETHFQRQNLAGAARLYEQLTTATNVDERTQAFIRHRRAALEVEQRLKGGDWVAFLPTEQGDPNWVFSRGNPKCLQDGALEMKATSDGYFLFSRARVGSEIEVKGEFEVVASTNRAFQTGLAIGLPELHNSNWLGIRMRRNASGRETVRLARGWNNQGPIKPVKLNDGPNSFLFRLHGGKVSLSVNDQELWSNIAPPRGVAVPESEFRLGLTATPDKTENVIRYRDLRVRRLAPPPSKKLLVFWYTKART